MSKIEKPDELKTLDELKDKYVISHDDCMVNLTYLLWLDPNWAHGKFTIGRKENKMTSDTLPKVENEVKKYYHYIPNPRGDYGGTLSKISQIDGGIYEAVSNLRMKERKVHIAKVLYNNPATIVFWSDGTQTRNICPPDTLYNPDTGLAFCMLKKLMGNTEMAKLFNDWELKDYHNDKNHYVELKDVRKAHKKGKDK